MLAPNCIQVAPPSEIGRSHPGLRTMKSSSSWLYEPRDGVTCDIPPSSPLSTRYPRVCRGVPLLGRTEILIRDPELTFDGRC
jgi:hypothetical protein